MSEFFSGRWARAAIVLTLGAARLPGQAASATGTLSGQVLDEAQRPVQGARIDVSAIPGGAAAFHPHQGSAKSLANGTFTLALPAGLYRVCAQLRTSELLNPCLWANPPLTATVTAGQTLKMHSMVLKRGYPLTVQLIDNTSALWNETAKHSKNLILVNVSAANGMSHPMPVRQQNSVLREHVILVPRDTALQVTVSNFGFDLTNTAGAPFALSAQPQSFSAKIAGEKSPQFFQFYVTGLHRGN